MSNTWAPLISAWYKSGCSFELNFEASIGATSLVVFFKWHYQRVGLLVIGADFIVSETHSTVLVFSDCAHYKGKLVFFKWQHFIVDSLSASSCHCEGTIGNLSEIFIWKVSEIPFRSILISVLISYNRADLIRGRAAPFNGIFSLARLKRVFALSFDIELVKVRNSISWVNITFNIYNQFSRFEIKCNFCSVVVRLSAALFFSNHVHEEA